jgi:hypothetical protein
MSTIYVKIIVANQTLTVGIYVNFYIYAGPFVITTISIVSINNIICANR